jgi:hypothetical protein
MTIAALLGTYFGLVLPPYLPAPGQSYMLMYLIEVLPTSDKPSYFYVLG